MNRSRRDCIFTGRSHENLNVADFNRLVTEAYLETKQLEKCIDAKGYL